VCEQTEDFKEGRREERRKEKGRQVGRKELRKERGMSNVERETRNGERGMGN